MKKIKTTAFGFTIIEVLIVLAIASLILLIVFMAVPALQRNSRNSRRKGAVTFALTTVMQYYVDHGGIYPFVSNGIPDPDIWDNYYDGYIKGTPMDGFTYNILPLNTTDFSYVGPLDEITFSTGHWCNKDPASGDSIAGDGKRDKDVVIWTKIEGSNKVYCVDNSTGQYTN